MRANDAHSLELSTRLLDGLAAFDGHGPFGHEPRHIEIKKFEVVAQRHAVKFLELIGALQIRFRAFFWRQMLETLHDGLLFWLSEQGVLKQVLPSGSVEIRTQKTSTGQARFSTLRVIRSQQGLLVFSP
jgi:hypothetical protein